MIPFGVVVEVPGGVWRNGARRRDVRIRPLEARQAVEFAENPASPPPVLFATRLLTKCLVEIAGETPVREDMVGELTAGDREALLLHVHRVTFGGRIDLLVKCPACATRLDVSVEASDLLVSPYRLAPSIRRRTLNVEGQRLVVRFRVPTGLDLEAAIPVEGEDLAARTVLERCVQSVSPPGDFNSLLQPLSVLMEDLDPQAELSFKLRCPDCEAAFTAFLDMARHLRHVVESQAKSLLREVHAIASAYHWSESEILSLSPVRRRRYLDLIDAYGAAG